MKTKAAATITKTAATTAPAKTATAAAITKTAAVVVITDQVRSKIEDAAKGLTPLYSRSLGLCNTKHIIVICDYISALRSEIKLSDKYRQSILTTLTTLSRISKSKKGFKD